MVLGLSEDEVSSFKETELGSLIFRVDPVSSVLRRFRTAQRRAYKYANLRAYEAKCPLIDDREESTWESTFIYMTIYVNL